jgi:hypothetical protein
VKVEKENVGKLQVAKKLLPAALICMAYDTVKSIRCWIVAEKELAPFRRRKVGKKSLGSAVVRVTRRQRQRPNNWYIWIRNS